MGESPPAAGVWVWDLSLSTRACGMDISAACYNLGYSYAAGLGMEKDPKRAAELYRKACDLGFETACEAAARLTPQEGVP